MNAQKIIGYTLLGGGVLVIAYALFASHGIFTGSSNAPELFKEPAREAGASASRESQENVQRQIEGLLEEQLSNLLPTQALPRTFNLFAWSVFAGLLVFGGSHLASLGVKLVKT